MTSDQPETQEEETPSESPILSAARQYFIELAKKSDVLRSEMQQASTKTKQRYFQRKLKKNSAEAITVLSKLDGCSRNKALIEGAKKSTQAASAIAGEDEYR